MRILTLNKLIDALIAERDKYKSFAYADPLVFFGDPRGCNIHTPIDSVTSEYAATNEPKLAAVFVNMVKGYRSPLEDE